MIYEYRCESCDKNVDVCKGIQDYDRPEACECGAAMHRVFRPAKIYLANTAVQESYFHPALGQVVKGDIEARKLAKAKGYIEVGNERPSDYVKPPSDSDGWNDV